MNKLSVSAIVPVFNEDKTVGKIVSLLIKTNLVNEIICINDGSTDQTFSILKSFGKKIKLISFKKNRGKGFALSKGIHKAKSDLVMFIDGDLENISARHIATLLAPIISNKYKGVMGIPLAKKRNPRNYIAIHFIDKYVTGERVYFKKDLISHLSRMSRKGYGIEIFLNSLFKKEEIKLVFLKGLKSPCKEDKWSFHKALKSYAIAGGDITQELGKQIVKKQYKRIKNSTFINSFIETIVD